MGKGLTFDSGGYNLKVGGMIEMMKFDMGGAAAVLGAAQALALLKPKGVTVRACRFSQSACQHSWGRPMVSLLRQLSSGCVPLCKSSWV